MTGSLFKLTDLLSGEQLELLRYFVNPDDPDEETDQRQL